MYRNTVYTINIVVRYYSNCGRLGYKETKQIKKNNKRSLSGWVHVTGCLTSNTDGVSEKGGGGWIYVAGAAEDLGLLLWQHGSQLHWQYEATRRDEL